jgi:hypothetical protein
MTSKASNHAKAPLCAAFVEAMRAVFGEVVVLYVRENGHELVNSDKKRKQNLPLPRSRKEAGADA